MCRDSGEHVRTVLLLPLCAAIVAATAAVDGPPPLASLASDWIPYHRGLGHFTDPGEWGSVRHGLGLPVANSLAGSVIADENVLAVRDLTFPPLTGGPYSTVARNVSRLARLKVDGVPVLTQETRWSPTAFERRAMDVAGGGNITTSVSLPLRAFGMFLSVNFEGATPGAVITIAFEPLVREFSAQSINCSLTDSWRFPTKDVRDCWNWYTPRSFVNESSEFSTSASADTSAIVSIDSVSGAVAAIAVAASSRRTSGAMIAVDDATVRVTVPRSGQLNLDLAVAVGAAVEGQAAVLGRARTWADEFDAAVAQANADRERRWAALFDPSPSSTEYFSGSLPVLKTEHEALSRIYYLGAASTLEVQRSTAELPGAPPSPQNLTFVVGSGGNATTNYFFWDQSYSATAFSLMQGVKGSANALRQQLLEFITFGGDDAKSGWGVDFMYAGGHSIGAHYAANDMSIFKAVLQYASVSGDWGILQEEVSDRSVLSWMEGFATAFRNLTRGGSDSQHDTSVPRLADYGGAHQLLECVPTYQHEVASFNAANPWMLRQLAKLLRQNPGATAADKSKAAAFEAEAEGLVQAVLELYREGDGFWSARAPNGTLTGVRHVIDYVYVSEFIHADLSDSQRQESLDFVTASLVTPTWMRALSLDDPAAPLSDRTDHGAHGSYDGWLPLTAAAFARSGNVREATAFLAATEAVTHLGPYGQAHAISDKNASDVYKPFEFTLYNELCGLAFVDAIITGVAGLQPTADDVPFFRSNQTAGAALPIAFPNKGRGVSASLLGLWWRGGLYDIHLDAEEGVRWERIL